MIKISKTTNIFGQKPLKVIYHADENQFDSHHDGLPFSWKSTQSTMTTLQILVIILAGINLLMSLSILFRIKQPASPVFWIIKAVPTALSPILAFIGLSTAIFGVILSSPLIILLGSGSTLIYFTHIVLVTRPLDPATGFEQAFGRSWESSISKTQRTHFLPRRTVLRLPSPREPQFEQDIVFYTIPETNRPLLCDLWQPPKNSAHSGLAFIYLHGSAWYVLDKDAGTRTFFRHLAAQGHRDHGCSLPAFSGNRYEGHGA